jgi:hypothetical protein
MFGTTEKILAAVSLAALLLLIPIFYLMPLLAFFYLPLFMPTEILYLSAFSLVYFAGFALLRGMRAPLWAARATAAILAVALVGYASWSAPGPANARTARDLAALEAKEKVSPMPLVPVRGIALVSLRTPPEPFTSCDSFCMTLLLSGTAQEVQVASLPLDTALPPKGALAVGYRLSQGGNCIADDAAWDRSFGVRTGHDARASGGFDEAFAQRFGKCVTAVPAHPLAADLVFVDAMALSTKPPLFLGIDWRFPAVQVVDTQTLIDMRGGSPVVRLRRYDIFAYRVLAPLSIQPVSGSNGVPDGPGYWSRVDYGARDRGPFVEGWWSYIANADAIYAKAVGYRGG